MMPPSNDVRRKRARGSGVITIIRPRGWLSPQLDFVASQSVRIVWRSTAPTLTSGAYARNHAPQGPLHAIEPACLLQDLRGSQPAERGDRPP